jgi:hypothetical protein
MQISWKVGLTTALLSLAGGPAVTSLQAAQPQTCAHVKQINNFRYVDDATAIFETGPQRQYKVTFNGQCRDLKWASAVRVESRPGICLRSGDVVVFSRDGVIPERCIVKSVEALPAT